MTHDQIKDYLLKYNIQSEEQLASHIEELKKNTVVNNELVFPLVEMLLNEKSVLNSFFRENEIKSKDEKFSVLKSSIIKSLTTLLDNEMKEDYHSRVSSTPMFLTPHIKFTILEENTITAKEQEKLSRNHIKNHSTRHKATSKAFHLDEVLEEIAEKENKEQKVFDQLEDKTDNAYKLWENGTDKTFIEDLPPYRGMDIVKEIEEYAQRISNPSIRQGKIFSGEIEAVKHSEDKLFYELDFNFITQMAERMQSNKVNSKYELWNWKRPMTPKGLEDLKMAMWRHIIAVMGGELEDDGREFGHLEAISNNAMMLNYQLKNNFAEKD